MSLAFWDHSLLNQIFLKYVVSFLKLWFSDFKIWGVFVGGGSSYEIQKNHTTSLLTLKELLLHCRVYIWSQLLWSSGTVFWGKNWQPDYILYFYSIMGPQSIFPFHFFLRVQVTYKIKSLFKHLYQETASRSCSFIISARGKLSLLFYLRKNFSLTFYFFRPILHMCLRLLYKALKCDIKASGKLKMHRSF